jgi:hypothetical protein
MDNNGLDKIKQNNQNNQKSYKHKDLRIKSKRIKYKNKVIDIRKIKEKIRNIRKNNKLTI